MRPQALLNYTSNHPFTMIVADTDLSLRNGDQLMEVCVKQLKRCRRWMLSVLGVGLLRLISPQVSLATNQLIGATLAAVIAAIKPRTRQVTQANLAVCLPHLGRQARERIARQSFRELGKLAFEVGYLWNADATHLRSLITEVEGQEIRRHAEAQGGVIYVTPHLGCWEMTGLYLALEQPLYCLYKQAPFAIVERFVCGGREASGLRLCLSNAGGVKQLLRALDTGANIGLLPDQVPPHGQGVSAPFFGRPAYTMTLLVKLARRAPVVFTFAERQPQGRGYRICFSKPPADIYDADPVRAATAINAAVAQLVRRCPQQYFWAYKRFTRSPVDLYRRR